MKTARMSDQFKAGHTYFSETRSGRVRLFEVVKVFKNARTGEHISLIAKYDGKPEQRYEIKKGNGGHEFVYVDSRFCTVIDTTEIVKDIVITDDMISDVHAFNNCGQCIVTVSGEQFKASWNHGEVIADESIKDAFRAYIYG